MTNWMLQATVLMTVATGLGATAQAADEPDPEALYQQQKIEVTTAMLSPARNNSLSPRRFQPTLGGASLRGVLFYEAIDRPDLGATFKRRQRIRWSLYGAGAGLFVGGLATTLVGVLRDPQSGPLKLGGAITMVAGLVTMSSAQVFNHFAPSHPIEPAVAKDLIDQHNAGLRRQLGMGPTARVRVAPQVGRSMAGVSVSGRF
ncbi:MAG: hypothetical protein K0V04_14710 [Deltaproteobacteria bacterium]|nr:hypothetical protein [Deltaproteobacteria bacterium]